MFYIDAPANKEPLTLFEYSVKKVISLGMMNDANVHQVWANLIFKYEQKPYMRQELMSIVKREYSNYFTNEIGQYKFIEDKIRNNFPYLYGIKDKLTLFERMLAALEAECAEQKDPRNRKIYRISSCENIPSQDEQYIYKAVLRLEEGDDPHFTEGVSFELRTTDKIYTCDVVEFDYVNATLFFSSVRPVFANYDSRVVTDATMNIIALMNLLQEISLGKIEEYKPLYKFIHNKTRNLKSIQHGQYPSYLNDMLSKDLSQFEAFRAALDKDITFIWGPPGTGKSYTLSAIIMALYKMTGERTAVCCLSNVAVDQLVNKVVDIIDEHEPDMQNGEFYRAGRTQDSRILKKDYLFPDDKESRLLRKKIAVLVQRVDEFKKQRKQYSDDAIKVKNKLKDAREKLKTHTDHMISEVKVVFSTISNFVINSRLKDGEFDNLIVDEASMLAEPQLIALAKNVNKRIILVGDFQQLSPITTAGVPILRNSVFKLCGIDINNTDHPALHQLLNQRRSNPKLVEIINKPFYANRLVAQNNKHNPIVARAPFSSNVIGMVSVDNGEVRFTKGGTRQNVANAEAVMNLLELYSEQEEETFSIGVITPYTGQVAMLKALFIKRGFDLDFQDRVKIGTVHTFQGSECDVIIFDMVDCSKFYESNKQAYFGKIYSGEQGEQLLNVAISRARHKLIIICDPDYLNLCPGDKVSDRSKEIFKGILGARFTRP